MIAIINIDENPRPAGPHLYELRINRTAVIRFFHNREDPLSEILCRAAAAVEGRGMVRLTGDDTR